MKVLRYTLRNFIVIVITITFGINTNGQGTIKTPKNQTVYVWNDYDSPTWIAIWEADAANWIDIYDSDAQRIGPATSNYNCHAYAWHVSDGGNDEDCWLDYDYFGSSNLQKYWTNDAYVSTSSPNEFNKVFYGTNADHSAISTSSGVVKSKWGAWPLYQHETTDCPYDNISIAFYKIPISGDDLTCTSKTYSTVNISNATYSWSGGRVSTSGYSYSTTATKTSDGKGWIHAEISSPYSGTTVKSEKKEIWVGVPVISEISGSTYTPNNNWATYYAEPNDYLMDADNYNWALSPINGNVIYDYGWTADIAFYNSGSYQVYAQAHNICGWGSYNVTGVEVYDNLSLSIFPNPTTEQASLTIESTSLEKSFDEDTEWDLEIYDQVQTLKEKKTKLRGKEQIVQTAGWREGVYFVRVKYKDKLLTGQLVVKQ